MADVSKIVERIRANGANVTIEGGRLRIANSDRLPAGAREYIVRHGKEIAAFLDKEAEFEERAAILQYDGGLTRPIAEYMARFLMSLRMDGVSEADWTYLASKAAQAVERELARAA